MKEIETIYIKKPGLDISYCKYKKNHFSRYLTYLKGHGILKQYQI